MLNLISWIKLILDKIKKDHLSAYAAQSAFFIILSAVPFVMLLLTLVQYAPIDSTVLIEGVKIFFLPIPAKCLPASSTRS